MASRSLPREADSLPLGIRPALAQPALQSDAFKELVNKLAWAIGSTYNAPYNNVRTPSRAMAVKFATAVVKEHGYPKSIGYPH